MITLTSSGMQACLALLICKSESAIGQDEHLTSRQHCVVVRSVVGRFVNGSEDDDNDEVIQEWHNLQLTVLICGMKVPRKKLKLLIIPDSGSTDVGLRLQNMTDVSKK